MHWTQAAYVLLLLGAFKAGRPDRRIVAVMLLNLAFTYVLAGAAHITAVAAVDLASAALLIGRSARSNIVAMLFAIMPPLYVASKYGGFSDASTYAIVDIIAYAQCAVIGRFDAGIRNFYRDARDRLSFMVRPMAHRRDAPISHSVADFKSKGMKR